MGSLEGEERRTNSYFGIEGIEQAYFFKIPLRDNKFSAAYHVSGINAADKRFSIPLRVTFVTEASFRLVGRARLVALRRRQVPSAVLAHRDASERRVYR